MVAQTVENPPAMQEAWVQSLGWEDLLEMGKATHSSILARTIPWTIQSVELQRVRHDWMTLTFPGNKGWSEYTILKVYSITSRLWAQPTNSQKGTSLPKYFFPWLDILLFSLGSHYTLQPWKLWPSFIGTCPAGFKGMLNSIEFYTEETSLRKTIIITYLPQTWAQF